MPAPASSATADPFAVYVQATGFMKAEIILRQKVEEFPGLEIEIQYPGIVLNAFASELLFKCLLLLDGKGRYKKHDLKFLYDQLSDNIKKLIKAEWDLMQSLVEDQYKYLEHKFNTTIPRDLKTSLTECGNSFEDARYVYEKRAVFYMTHLPMVLKNVARSLKREWPELVALPVRKETKE